MNLFFTFPKGSKTCLLRSLFLCGCLSSALPLQALKGPQSSAPLKNSSEVIDSFSVVGLQERYMKKSLLKTGSTKGRIGYQHGQLSFGSLDRELFEQSEQTKIDLGLTRSAISWKESSYFDATSSYNLFAEALHHFQFDIPIGFHAHGRIETDLHGRQVGKYSMAFLTLWASKEVKEHQLSLGLYQELGRKSHLLLPVIGVQKRISERWTLDCLLPFHTKLLYSLEEPLQFYAGLKIFRDRQKGQPCDDPTYSKSIWSYQALLSHLGFSYNYLEIMRATVEATRALHPSFSIYEESGAKKERNRIADGFGLEVKLDFLF